MRHLFVGNPMFAEIEREKSTRESRARGNKTKDEDKELQ